MYRLGLIGFPIQHSLSPWIHQRFLKKANLTGTYELIEIDPTESFEQAIEALKERGLDGFNVTVPYKEKIMPYLDRLDAEAQAIGAVNTVVNEHGLWVGYNTDGKGYVRALENKYPALFATKTQRILVLGAGGAARGIYCALTALGCQKIDIANRTAASARDIATLAQGETETSVLTLTEAEENLQVYDLIIQTTSVGMKPDETKSIISLDRLKQPSIVSDIVYQPIETTLLQTAKQQGASIHHGHTMLLYQALDAFELWTHKKITIEEMDKQLQQELKGR